MSYFISVSETVRDHFLDEANLRYVRITLDVGGTPLTVSPMQISCDAAQDYQRWSIRLKNRAVYSVGQYANTAATIEFSHNNSDWITMFTGYASDSGFHRSRGYVTEDYVSFELVDATSRKGTRRKPDKVLLSGFKICDTTTTTASILHYLVDLMGVTLNATEIDYTKTLVELGSDTAWTELQKVRDAFHADMYFDASGELLFVSPFDTGYSAPSSEWTFQGDPDNAVSGDACRIRGTLEEVYLPVRCNYAKADYSNLEALDAQTIYRNTENWDSVLEECSITVAAGEYWPGPNEGDLAKLNFADPESGEEFPFAVSVDTPSVGTTSASQIYYSGGTIEIISFNGSTGATTQGSNHAQIILRNTGGTTATIKKLEITGTPYRVSSDDTVEVIDSAVSDAVDYVERQIDGKYATSVSQIYDTLYYIKEEGKGRPRQFRFSAPFMPWLQRNAIISVQPPDESAVRCRIDTYQHRNIGKTLQSMVSSIVCTELGTYTPTGSPVIQVDRQISPILAKITSISPNAGATYRSESTSAPVTPMLGDLWYQTDTKLMKRYSGSSWENTGASPLEESSTAGVDYENSTGNVQILSDGTLKAVGIEAVDGQFSGSLTAADGKFGSIETEFLYQDSTGTTFTSADTYGDVITFIYGYTGSYISGSIQATFNGKTYIAYERFEKGNVRSIDYEYSYKFYASDGTDTGYIGEDTSLPSDFVVLSIMSKVTVNSDIEVKGELTVANIYMPVAQSLYFTVSAGATTLKSVLSNFSSSTTYTQSDILISGCTGTIRISCTASAYTANKSNVYVQYYINGDTVHEFSFGGLTVGTPETLTYDITINAGETLSVAQKDSGTSGGTYVATAIQISDSVIGATATALGMVEL